MDEEIIAGLVIGIIGLCLLLGPRDKLWAVTGKWMVKDGGEPSEKFNIITKVVGAVFAVVGAWLIISEIL